MHLTLSQEIFLEICTAVVWGLDACEKLTRGRYLPLEVMIGKVSHRNADLTKSQPSFRLVPTDSDLRFISVVLLIKIFIYLDQILP